MLRKDAFLDEFSTAALGGQAALFAGAGVPADCGLPTWGTALAELANELESEGAGEYARLMRLQIAQRNYLQAAEIFGVASNELTKDRKYAALRSVFGKNAAISGRVVRLMSIPFRLVITTNFDTTIEDAYAAAHERSLDIFDNTQEGLRAALAPERPAIVHLHGRIAKPESLVLTRSDYAELQTWEWYRNFLRLVLRDYAVLFVGFSFDDPAMRLVLEATSEELPPNPAKQAYALVPASKRESFSDLRAWNVSVLDYQSESDHEEMWSVLENLASRLGSAEARTSAEARSWSELELVKENLAAGYTHFVASRRHPNAVRSVYAGLVYSAMIDLADDDTDRCSLGVIEDRLASIFSFTRSQVRQVLDEGVSSLEREDWIARRDEDVIELTRTPDQSLSTDLRSLAEAVVNRTLVRTKTDLDVETDAIAAFILEVLLLHGMAIGHAVIRGRPLSIPQLDEVLIEGFVDTFGTIRPYWREPLLEGTRSMFVNPTAEEDALITSVARMVFVTDVLVDAPALASLTGSGFVKSVILDTNVLLPASLTNHPDEALYARLFDKVDELGGQLMTTSGFVNELVSHRDVARRRIRKLGLDERGKLVEYVRMYGTYGVSDLIVSYAYAIEREDFSGGFDEFLRKQESYESEEATREALEQRGVRVVDLTETTGYDRQRMLGWYGALKDLYQGGKSSEVIDHEAALLEALVANVERSRPVWVVTNDRGLIRVLERLVESHPGVPAQVLQVMLTPVQLLGYADLSAGNVDWSGFSRLLCNPGFRDFEGQIEDYVRGRLIREFQERAAGSITELVAAIHRELGGTIDEVVRTHSSRSEQEDAFFQRFEEFEEAFYETVAERVRGAANDG